MNFYFRNAISYIKLHLRYRIDPTYDVVYDIHESHRYYTMSNVKYDFVGAYRPKREIYAYDVYIRYRIRYIIRYILSGAAAGAADRTGQAPATPTAPAS